MHTCLQVLKCINLLLMKKGYPSAIFRCPTKCALNVPRLKKKAKCALTTICTSSWNILFGYHHCCVYLRKHCYMVPLFSWLKAKLNSTNHNSHKNIHYNKVIVWYHSIHMHLYSPLSIFRQSGSMIYALLVGCTCGTHMFEERCCEKNDHTKI